MLNLFSKFKFFFNKARSCTQTFYYLILIVYAIFAFLAIAFLCNCKPKLNEPLPELVQKKCRHDLGYRDHFEEAFQYISKSEGGYINHKYDAGGETKFGIAKRWYPNVNIKELTLDQAKIIYYEDYWLRYNLDKLIHRELAIKVFDTMIVIGPRMGTLLLEESIQSMGYQIPADGIFDPELIYIANTECDQIDLIDRYQILMEEYFKKIVASNPSQKVFLQGWINRARNEPIPHLCQECD